VTPTDIKRDRFGRPLVIPTGGGKPVGYTRVSTLAKALDDQQGLIAWKQRMTAIGVVLEPSIRQQVAAVINSHPDPVADGKQALNGLVERATEAAGSIRAASTGTAVHELTEVLDTGGELKVVPEELAPVLDAYAWGTTHLDMVEAEVFVVVDEITSAGTLDRLVRLRDGRVVVGDVKTGRDEPKYAFGVTTQVAAYAHGQRYDPATGERTPLHPDLDTTMGLLIHLPIRPVDGKFICDVWELDLVAGWRKALLAHQVRAERTHPKLRKMVP